MTSQTSIAWGAGRTIGAGGKYAALCAISRQIGQFAGESKGEFRSDEDAATTFVPPVAVEIGALAKWLCVWATKLCHEKTTNMASSTATQPAPSRRPERGGRDVLPMRLALVAIVSDRSFDERVAVVLLCCIVT
jgi:hypothetical protein